MSDTFDLFALLNGEADEEAPVTLTEEEKETEAQREVELLKEDLMEIEDDEPTPLFDGPEDDPVSGFTDETEVLPEAEPEKVPVPAEVPQQESETPVPAEEPIAEPVKEEKQEAPDPLSKEEFDRATAGMSDLEKAGYKLDLFEERIGKTSNAVAVGNWQGLISFLQIKMNTDEKLVQEVLQDHKTVDRMNDYIFTKARNLAEDVRKGKATPMVCDDIVYGWAESYFREDDLQKILEEEQRRKAAEEKAAAAKAKTGKKTSKAKTKADAKLKEKPRKEDDQIDLFSLLSQG